MELTTLAYAPLMEQEEVIPELNWEKSTIKYVIKNRTKVMNNIRSAVRSIYKSPLPTMDIEDIYDEVLDYLYKCDDYDKDKAIGFSIENGSQTIISLEGYVGTCIKYCVKRFISSMYEREKEIARDVTRDEEGRESRILDIIPDKTVEEHYNRIGYSVESALKVLEYKRYKYGADVYLILFIRLLTLNKPEVNYRQILDILEISRKDLSELEKKMGYDEDILHAIKALALKELKEAIEAVKPYIYSEKIISNAIQMV